MNKADQQLMKFFFGFVPLFLLFCACPVVFAGNVDSPYLVCFVSPIGLLVVGLLAFGIFGGKVKLLGG